MNRIDHSRGGNGEGHALHEYTMFGMDDDGFVTSWNDRMEVLFGYRGEEIIGRHFSVLYPSDRVAAGTPDHELRRAAESGLHMDQGWRLRKDGSRFWASVAITAQRSDDGSPGGFIVVTRDESEARARHQRSSRRFTELFDLAPVGIGLFDESDRVLHANAALCRLLGYRLDELHGVTGARLLHPDDDAMDIVPALSEQNLSGGAVRQRILARSDGSKVICDVHGAMSMEDDGVRFWQVVFQDVTEQHRRTEVLHHRATHDELTGLPNRSGIHEQLDELLAGSGSDRVAVLFCDLDNFKRVNDSLGHSAGDELLVTLAQRLTAGLPRACATARIFGDQFVVICRDIGAVGGLDELTAAVSRLMQEAVPVRDVTIELSASIGAAVVENAETTSHDLLRFADAAMFTAKNGNRGGVAVASAELLGWTNRQVQLEGQLRDTIRNDELLLHYHPVVTHDGTIVMAEALLRWQHPVLGMVAPDLVLSIAEQGNLLRELDCSVLRTALREAASWPLVQGEPVRIAVNLSGLLPNTEHFAEDVAAMVRDSGIDWNRVVLEVVETYLSDLSDRALAGMVELVRRGALFAIDDFGTAYSSLKRLKDLPVQIIKIDRYFVSGAEKNTADRAIVRAVVDMSRGLSYNCVAEGVENIEQFHLMEGMGVDVFQGFLFSHPLPAPRFRILLRTGVLSVEPA